MNTQLIVGIVVALVVGIGAWLFLSHDKAVAPSTTESERTTGSSVTASQSAAIKESFTGTGSFLDLMGMGRDLMCNFSYVADDTNAAVAGTVMVSGEDIRGDFEMEQANMLYKSHMIQDGTTIYTWSESPQGNFAIMMPLNEAEEADSTSSSDYERPVNMDNDVDYDCQPWSADASVFVPPQDVEFMSPEAMMQGMMQQHGLDPRAFAQ